MRQKPRQIFNKPQVRISSVIDELLIRETEKFTAIERHSYFEYVECLAKELSNLSKKAENSFLSYLLNLAVREAQSAKRIAGREISAT